MASEPVAQVDDAPAPAETTGEGCDDAARIAAWKADLVRYRDHLWTLRQTAMVQADSLILGLSGVLLTFSVSFVTNLVPLSRAACVWALLFSWGFLSIAVVGVLASQVVGRQAIEKRLRAVEDAISDPTATKLRDDPRFTKCAESLNIVAGLGLFAGVVLTIVFAIMNII